MHVSSSRPFVLSHLIFSVRHTGFFLQSSTLQLCVFPNQSFTSSHVPHGHKGTQISGQSLLQPRGSHGHKGPPHSACRLQRSRLGEQSLLSIARQGSSANTSLVRTSFQ